MLQFHSTTNVSLLIKVQDKGHFIVKRCVIVCLYATNWPWTTFVLSTTWWPKIECTRKTENWKSDILTPTLEKIKFYLFFRHFVKNTALIWRRQTAFVQVNNINIVYLLSAQCRQQTTVLFDILYVGYMLVHLLCFTMSADFCFYCNGIVPARFFEIFYAWFFGLISSFILHKTMVEMGYICLLVSVQGIATWKKE